MSQWVQAAPWYLNKVRRSRTKKSLGILPGVTHPPRSGRVRSTSAKPQGGAGGCRWIRGGGWKCHLVLKPPPDPTAGCSSLHGQETKRSGCSGAAATGGRCPPPFPLSPLARGGLPRSPPVGSSLGILPGGHVSPPAARMISTPCPRAECPRRCKPPSPPHAGPAPSWAREGIC